MTTKASEPIITDRLVIRRVQHADLQALLSIHSVPEVNQYLPGDTWLSMADAEAWYQANLIRERGEKPGEIGNKAAHFVIERSDDQQLIGTCLYFNHRTIAHSCEFGYVLGQPYWQQGYMYEAMFAFVEHIKTALNLSTLYAKVERGNTASLSLLTKLGLSEISMLKEGDIELHYLRKQFK